MRTEVSPIKCDVRECVVRTSDCRECVIRMRNCRSNGRFYVLMADFTMGNGTFYRNGGQFWRMWLSNDTFWRIWRSNDTFSNVTFYRRDLCIALSLNGSLNKSKKVTIFDNWTVRKCNFEQGEQGDCQVPTKTITIFDKPWGLLHKIVRFETYLPVGTFPRGRYV